MRKRILKFIQHSHHTRNKKPGWHLEWSIKGDLEIWSHKLINLNDPSKKVLIKSNVINPNFPIMTRNKVCTLLTAKWVNKLFKTK